VSLDEILAGKWVIETSELVSRRPLETDFAPFLTEHPTAADDPAWPEFVRAMRGRAFGGEALEDAWAWFAAGWEARENL
jgi:hypothetical protein